jgi:hypothetical protein
MGAEFGDLRGARIDGADVVLTGHQYVALAFDRDDPILEVRLVGAAPTVDESALSQLAQAGDVYEAFVVGRDGAPTVVVRLGDEDIRIRCLRVERTARWYVREELAEIVSFWGESDAELARYVESARRRGFALRRAGAVWTVEPA